MSAHSLIRATGSALPKHVLTNHDLAQKVETSNEWIVSRTGIEQRHIAQETETASILGIQAAQNALDAIKWKGSDIDLIICATSTPDLTMPSTAVLIQAALGARGPAFDIQAVCSGFIYALSLADSLLRTGTGTRALVIGSEIFSRVLNWQDRTTCVLFGDGAGAVILEKNEVTDDQDRPRGILRTYLDADGKFASILNTTGGVGTTQSAGYIQMNGREVYRHGVEKMSQVVIELLEEEGLMPQDIDWLIPHQANLRIMKSVAEKLNVPLEKVIVTVNQHANTSAATIPLALDHANRAGQLKKGDLIALTALGAGLTWGGALVRW